LKREANKLHLHQNGKLVEIQTTLDEFRRIMQSNQSNDANNFSDSDIQALGNQLSTFHILKIDIARDHSLVKSLRFRRQPERHSLITDAHRETFSWILEPSSTVTEATKLRRWLEHKDGGIFWISGKPGSGKSTLMKFIADNEETKKILSVWASGRKLIVPSHYFWWSGTTLQKSQEGLLRTLLCSILEQCPDLIRLIRDKDWAKYTNTANFELAEGDDTGSWTLENLRSAFHAIAHDPELPVRFCFFIDGLDEYAGDHIEICDTFIHLVKACSAIKLCLSSRPWNVFKQAFGNKPERIYIHDLTREDIRLFAQSKLSQNIQWRPMSLESSTGQELVDAITERAHGVFLWVFLVTRLLCEGLTNGDSLSDLRLRLETFPIDLESFFKDILDRVDSFYHAKLSAALQIALTAEEPLDLSVYAFLEEEIENREYVIDRPICLVPKEFVKERHRIIAQRLNGWSKGLLEVRNQEVHFLHRTVVDFLRTRDMENFLAEKSPSWFCASLSLLKAYLAWIKTSDFPDRFPMSAVRLPHKSVITLVLLVRKAVRWAFKTQSTLQVSSPVQYHAGLLLDDMDRSIETLIGAPAKLGFPCKSTAKQMLRIFRRSVLHGHLTLYLSRKLRSSPGYFQILGKPGLSVLIETGVTKDWVDTLRCLLAAGQDPNQEYRDPDGSHGTSSPWTKFMSNVILRGESQKGATRGDDFTSAMCNGAFSLFLEHGADPNALIFRYSDTASPIFSTAWVDMLLMFFELCSVPGDQEVYLEELKAFLRHGAKVDAPLWTSIITLQNDTDDDEISAYGAFFSMLTERINTADCDSSFLEQVAKILLIKMQDSGIELHGALQRLRITLAPVRFQRLHDDLEERGPAISARNKKRKKRRGGKSAGGQKMSK
jgi:hypothetical protein